MAAQRKVWVGGRSLCGTVRSNLASGMDVFLLCVVCVVRLRFLRWADHTSKGVVPSVVCPVSATAKPNNGGRP